MIDPEAMVLATADACLDIALAGVAIGASEALTDAALDQAEDVALSLLLDSEDDA